jgi:hypothetical protein
MHKVLVLLLLGIIITAFLGCSKPPSSHITPPVATKFITVTPAVNDKSDINPTVNESHSLTNQTTSFNPPSPRAPVNALAEPLSGDTIKLDWLDNSNDEDGFNIYRGNKLIGSVTANSETFTDNELEEGVLYRYAIKAFNEAGESAAVACSATTKSTPLAPDNLIADSKSKNEMHLYWNDNSDNEDGFKIFRDGDLIDSVDRNVRDYPDAGLNQATTYKYVIQAFNDVGESAECVGSFKTRNPSIKITLSRIGTYENGESQLRGKGEIYLLIGIINGDQSAQIRLPGNNNQYYSLGKNDATDRNDLIYSTGEIADNFAVLFVGYESDGGEFEQLAYKALAMALDNYLTGGQISGLADLFNVNLGNIAGSLLGAEDDFLGRCEIQGNKNNNWGIKSYKDITLKDEKGVDCLRLWFTID